MGGFKDNSKLFKINGWLDYDSKKYEVKKRKKEEIGDWEKVKDKRYSRR